MATTLEQRSASSGADRITVALTSRVARELERLKSLTELSKTDLVNRAISLYLLVENQRSSGKKLAFYDEDSKDVQLVELL